MSMLKATSMISGAHSQASERIIDRKKEGDGEAR